MIQVEFTIFKENRSVKRHLNQEKFMGASREVVVVSGVCTAIGDCGGSLKDFPLVDLAASVVAEAIKRADLYASKIGQVVMVNVIHTDDLLREG